MVDVCSLCGYSLSAAERYRGYPGFCSLPGRVSRERVVYLYKLARNEYSQWFLIRERGARGLVTPLRKPGFIGGRWRWFVKRSATVLNLFSSFFPSSLFCSRENSYYHSDRSTFVDKIDRFCINSFGTNYLLTDYCILLMAKMHAIQRIWKKIKYFYISDFIYKIYKI